jgi:hypothetical protein
VFKGDSADMCGGKFPLVLMGGRADRQACADGERGPPSARAEFTFKTPTQILWVKSFYFALPPPPLKKSISFFFSWFLGD